MTKEQENMKEFVQQLNPEAKQRLAQALEDYETPETPKATTAERPAPRNQMHEDLKNINKELHNIAQELEKINRTMAKRK